MRNVAVFLTALLLAGGAALPLPAAAASCCGGAGNTDLFGLPKWQSGVAGSAVQIEHTTGVRDAAGRQVQGGPWQTTDVRGLVSGAWRVHADGQAHLTIPWVARSVDAGAQAARGNGLGDLGAQYRYEFMDEETCFARPVESMRWDEVKPSIHGLVRATAPTGRSAALRGDPLGASITGRGLWIADAGIEATKIWGRFGNSLALTGGRQWGATSSTADAWRWEAATGVLYYFRYQGSAGIFVGHRREIGDVGVAVRSTTLSLNTTHVVWTDWWLRATAGTAGVLEGRNTPVTWTGGVALGKLF